MDGPEPPAWLTLLDRALPLIDDAETRHGSIPWSLGGGTALARYYAHRESHDIDLFVPDPQ